MAQRQTYKVGDIVFFSTSNNTVAGEGMFIGRVKASPDDLVLVIGKQVVEMAADYCTPTRRGFRAGFRPKEKVGGAAISSSAPAPWPRTAPADKRHDDDGRPMNRNSFFSHAVGLTVTLPQIESRVSIC